MWIVRVAIGILSGLSPYGVYQFIGCCFPALLDVIVYMLVMMPTALFFGTFYVVAPIAMFAHGWAVITILTARTTRIGIVSFIALIVLILDLHVAHYFLWRGLLG